MTYRTALRVAMTLACVTPLTGCNSLQKGAEATVRDGLKDPESARFGKFYYNAKTKKACLTVNAKNSMGGYTGDKEVQLRHDDDRWVWVDEEDSTKDHCKEYYADIG